LRYITVAPLCLVHCLATFHYSGENVLYSSQLPNLASDISANPRVAKNNNRPT